jgi:hypothetical protein
MDESRRKMLYLQLKLILMELLWGKPEREEITDDSVLRIHASEVVGTKERMM